MSWQTHLATLTEHRRRKRGGPAGSFNATIGEIIEEAGFGCAKRAHGRAAQANGSASQRSSVTSGRLSREILVYADRSGSAPVKPQKAVYNEEDFNEKKSQEGCQHQE
jgi:hypothetical protein